MSSRVHIVAGGSVPNENRIITRLAKLLEQETGWSRSAKADGSAYLNVYIPYLNRAEVTVETKAAAWFTHRDESLRPKVAVWKHIARAVQLRMTSARIYLPELSEVGVTRLVTPPLDREKFCPAPRQGASRRPVAGTSGFVYKWGRKAEGLLSALAASPIGQTAEWRAAGVGWPIACKLYHWRQLHEFYQGLDLYVCTSLIEGVGYGPLEALACGVKVVVPAHVGVFDDLPERPGIRHYQAGDEQDLRRAFARCLDDPHDAEALRETTAGYTAQAWASGWREAVAEVFGLRSEPVREEGAAGLAGPARETRPVVAAAAEACSEPDPAPAPPPSSRGRAGLFVVAFGEPSRQAAKRCIDAFKRHNPGLPVALCAERALGPEDLLIVQRDADIGARSPKVRIYDLAPAEWDYVLYLDADTEARGSLQPVLDWLSQGFELVICNNPGKFALAANMGRLDNSGECSETFDLWGSDQMMQLGGGVFAFRRCEATQRLFQRWADEWARYGKRDQGALLRAIWHEPVRTLMLLPRVWNCVAQKDEQRPGKLKYPYDDPKDAVVMHYPMTARRWQGIVPERSDSPEAWARVRQWERSHGQVAAR